MLPREPDLAAALIFGIIRGRHAHSVVQAGIFLGARPPVIFAIFSEEPRLASAFIISRADGDANSAVLTRLFHGAGSSVFLAVIPFKARFAIAEVGMAFLVANSAVQAGIRLAVLLELYLTFLAEITVFTIAEEGVPFLVTDSLVPARIRTAMLLRLHFASVAREALLAVAKKRVTFVVAGSPVHARVGLTLSFFGQFASVSVISIWTIAEERVTFVVTNSLVLARVIVTRLTRYAVRANQENRPKKHDSLVITLVRLHVFEFSQGVPNFEKRAE